MPDVRLAITTDQLPGLVALVRRLPGILSGRLPDVEGIAHGFRTRIGYAVLSLIGPNFDTLGRGEPGVDGTTWPPLTKEYLAYGRRFGPGETSALKGEAGLGKKHQYGPGDTKGLLTQDQLKLWRQTYVDRLAWYIMREPDAKAASHAAAIAWIVVKQHGAKTKLEVFGNRKVQMLVDTGYLRGSLLPGELIDQGVDAEYQYPSVKGGNEQEFDTSNPSLVIVGTNVEYAKHHHYGRGKRHRPLWPASFPGDWWEQIIRVSISGLQRISELYRNGRHL